jgi:hypothetical protein
VNPSLELSGDAWRVRFVHRDDRYAHVIEVAEADGFHAVLESIEGTASDAWPPSPPLQDLHIERHGDVQVALLVGRAGRSHWSLSIALDRASQTIDFDAACRTSDLPVWLGSTYRRTAAGSRAVSVDPVEGIDQPRYNDEHRTIALPAVVAADCGQQTIRWRYRIRLECGDTSPL